MLDYSMHMPTFESLTTPDRSTEETSLLLRAAFFLHPDDKRAREEWHHLGAVPRWQAGQIGRAPCSLSHIIIWHYTPIICNPQSLKNTGLRSELLWPSGVHVCDDACLHAVSSASSTLVRFPQAVPFLHRLLFPSFSSWPLLPPSW